MVYPNAANWHLKYSWKEQDQLVPEFWCGYFFREDEIRTEVKIHYDFYGKSPEEKEPVVFLIKSQKEVLLEPEAKDVKIVLGALMSKLSDYKGL